MRVSVRVVNLGRRELQALQRDIERLRAAQGKVAQGNATMMGGLMNRGGLEKYSKNLQWTGRQIEYNFTIPLALAGAAATKFALDNEKAATRLEKVYGDLNPAMQTTYKREIPQLRKAFEELSNIFGVHQSEVLDIAADWAAAGSSGIALARQTRATLEAMILGDMEAADATQALIAIQAQYNLSSKDLTDTLAMLNVVENQTAVSMADLISAFTRAAGSARTAGVDTRHLAAMVAAIVPAAGNAEKAGNALKTMISRVMSPTGDAAEVMNLMGLNIESAGWQSLTATERLLKMAEASENLTQGQKAVVSAVVASRWNITGFDVLMRELNSTMGYYQRALDATADKTKNFATYQRELGIYLRSSPQAFKILTTQLQNAMARIILPLIPAMLALMSRVVRLVDAFTELSPATQQFILVAALALAAVGPLARYIGAFGLLFSKLGGFLGIFIRGGGAATLVATRLGRTLLTIARFPFSMITKGLGAVVRAFLFLGNKGVLSAVWAPFQALVVGVSTAVLGLARVMLTTLGGAFRFIFVNWGSLGSAMATVWASVTTTLRTLWAGFVSFWSLASWAIGGWWGSITRQMTRIWAAGLTLMQTLWASVTTLLATVWGAFTAWWQATTSAMVGLWRITTNTLSVVWTATHGAMRLITGAFATYFATVSALLPVLFRSPAQAIVGIWSATLVLMRSITATFTAWWQLVWPALVSYFQIVMAALVQVWTFTHGAFRLIATGFAVFWRTVVGAFPAFLTVVRAALLRIWAATQIALNSLTAAFGTVWRIVTTAMPVIFTAVGTALVAVWRAVTGAMVLLMQGLPRIAALVGRAIVVAFTSPWGLAILAVAAFAFAFRKQISNAINWVAESWAKFPEYINKGFEAANESLGQFPEGVANVMRSVLRIIRDAALAIYDWLSYINPFARHSPSLVEQVQAGVDLIGRKYASLSNIGRNFRRAITDLDAFGKATLRARQMIEGTERNEMRANIVAVAPGAGASFDRLARGIDVLYDDLAKVGREFGRQESVVAGWKSKLDAANRTLDQAQARLDELSARADRARDALDRAQDSLDRYADAPLVGMRAMGDAIFANEMAQKRLRLEMLRWEEVNGPLDDVESKLSAIAGDIEKLKAESEELRLAGAGSDITGPINKQVKALEAQAAAMAGAGNPIKQMEDQLADLQRQGEILDLERSLKFDPLERQIERLLDTSKELTFSEVVNGVTAARAEVDRLTPVWEAANAAQERQKAIVDQLTVARDALNSRYNAENQTLSELGATYDAIEGKIRDMEQAMSDFAGMAAQALQTAKEAAMSPAAENFLAAGAGDFEVPGGEGLLGREEGDIEALAEQWAREAEAMFGDFDVFQPIKDMWNDAVQWVREHIPPGVKTWITDTLIPHLRENILGAGIGAVIGGALGSMLGPWGAIIGAVLGGGIGSAIQSAFSGEGDPFGGIREWWNGLVEDFNKGIGIIGGVADFFRGAWELVGGQVQQMLGMLNGVWDELWANLEDEFRNWDDLWEPLVEAAGHIWEVLKVIFAVGFGFLHAQWRVIWPILVHTLKPIFDTIVDVVVAAIKIIRGIIEFVLGVINGDWSMAWDGIKNIVAGTWDAIWAIISGAVGVVIGVIRGFIEGVISAFTWLWDVLVGHSIVPDIVNAILWWFRTLVSVGQTIFNVLVTVITFVFNAIATVITWWWQNIIQPVWTALVWVVTTLVIPGIQLLWDIAVLAFNAIAAVVTWWWNEVIKPAWEAASWYISNVLVPWFSFLWDVLSIVFNAIAGVVSWWWNSIVKPVWNAVVWFITGVLVPIFQFLWNVGKMVFEAIAGVITWWWNTVVKPVWTAVKDFIVNTLIPRFLDLKDRVVEVWSRIWEKINGVWEAVRPIFESIKNWIVETLIPKFQDLKDKVVAVWDGIKEKISDVWETINRNVRRGVNGGIRAINTLIRGIKGVVDALPGDLTINVSEIPELQLARGGSIPSKRVGGGFKTEGARAIVGEGRRGYPEYVVPTDPTYRSRALGLFGRLGEDLGVPGYFVGGTIGDVPIAGDVYNAVKDTGEKIAYGAVRELYKPFSELADEIIGRLPADIVREGASGAKSKVDAYIDSLGRETDRLAGEQAAAEAASSRNATGLHPVFVERFHSWNRAMGNVFSIGSGWRSYEQQLRLWERYQAGVAGQAPAARPGTSNHEKGLAIDLSPSSTTAAQRAAGAAHGLRWPMSYERWHVEPAPSVAAFLRQHGPSPGMHPGGTSGNPAMPASAIQHLAMDMLNRRGWGSYWSHFNALVYKESSWNPLAQNPTSTAFGLGQFLNSTWATVGGHKTTVPQLQLEYMMRYIAQRYGNPANALAFHLRNNYYKMGGALPTDSIMSMARGGSFITKPRPGGHLFRTAEAGKPERVTITPLGRDAGEKKGTTVVINGNLEFPNIKSGDDAEKLIDNLKSLADD